MAAGDAAGEGDGPGARSAVAAVRRWWRRPGEGATAGDRDGDGDGDACRWWPGTTAAGAGAGPPGKTSDGATVVTPPAVAVISAADVTARCIPGRNSHRSTSPATAARPRAPPRIRYIPCRSRSGFAA